MEPLDYSSKLITLPIVLFSNTIEKAKDHQSNAVVVHQDSGSA